MWRGIDAAAYKPNALWFCLVLGLVSIGAAFCYRLGKDRVATIAASFAAIVVFIFYFREFITSPEKEANFRVGLIILSSIAQLVVVSFPARR